MHGHLKFELVCLLGIALLGGVGSALWGAPVPWLLAGSAAYLGWHLFNLIRLSHFILNGKKFQELSPPGLWAVVYRNAFMLRRRSRKRRRKVSRFFKRFTEAAAALPDAAVILGQSGDVEWSNPAAVDLLGVDWPQAAGENLARMTRDPVLREYLEGADQERPLEFPSPVDQTKILSVYTTPFGKKNQRLLIARDITRTYYVDRMRRDFVANASHELRTPLTVIRGFLEVWRAQGEERVGMERSVGIMLDQTRRMEGTISDMLTLSRLEYGDEPVSSDTVSVAPLLDSILKEATALSGDSRHDISVRILDGRNLIGDAANLRGAFSNLVFNAVRHTPPRTKIRMLWDTHDQGAQFAVEDSGEGISARHIPRLTERFYRVDPGRSRDKGGTGLGLAIVRQVLERHDAELQISSTVGVGSTFACVFPEKRLAPPNGYTEEEAVGTALPGGETGQGEAPDSPPYGAGVDYAEAVTNT